jgi:protein tyrosine/serine phosphatase
MNKSGRAIMDEAPGVIRKVEVAGLLSVKGTQIPIKNLWRVNDWLYRGAQPSMESFAILSELNIKTVVNLRWQPGPVARERRRVEELGMQFEHISLNYWTLPQQKNVDDFLELLDDEQLRPIFVHCLHGKDRTGIMIAMYRILRCGWSLHQAYEEMVHCGFHRVATRHFKWALWHLAGRNK